MTPAVGLNLVRRSRAGIWRFFSTHVVHPHEVEILLIDDNLSSLHEFVGLTCQDINVTDWQMVQLES
ncbi:hypothetical protein TNCV_3335431 [Trichonephila clavipes]|nr:hypothetical protein TNCV_3335431 [Trichonephila clavipes]